MFSKKIDSPFLSLFSDHAKKSDSLLLEGLDPSAKAFLIAEFAKASKKSLIVLTGQGTEEFKLYNSLPFFSHHTICELASWETLPSEHIAPSPDVVGARYETLSTLTKEKGPFIVISTLQGIMQKLLCPSHFSSNTYTLKKGEKTSFQKLIEQIQEFGYEKKTLCTDKGEFSVRGGIIDIFPVTAPSPYRLEFFGDELESVRLFDPGSQKSKESVDSIQLSLAKEMEMLDKADQVATIFDYMKDVAVVFDDLEALEDRYASLTSLGQTASKSFLSIDELFAITKEKQALYFSSKPIEQLSQVSTNSKSHFYSKKAVASSISFEMFLQSFSAKRIVHPIIPLDTAIKERAFLDEEPDSHELLSYLVHAENDPPIEVLFCYQTEKEKEIFEKECEGAPFNHSYHKGYLSNGFVLDDACLYFFPMTEITGRIKVRRERQRVAYQSAMQDAFDIRPGETIVHYNHGIGKFIGIEKKKNIKGVTEEFFLIEYDKKAKLFVPLQQAHLISKYVGSATETPKYHVLGTSKWMKQRTMTEKAIVGYASELLKMYAERRVYGGFVYPEDTEETISFSEEFPYIETDDQLQAIQDVKEDMLSEKAMDRLICGDVGYGKTEVAMRAAFKAVYDGKKQVAVLVPTTVLALQHYETFLDRMQSFGINVSLVSRFKKPKEIKKSLEELEKGTIDIIVGTHRLLSKDVSFKDLGLIIIDEEQRFGVRAKEHLKRLKTGVDCLTLSATPIPRTLYMSLVGARDLSVIATPPQDRLPIKTVITEPNNNTIQTALLRELNRDGQAFYVHNRVETIYERANFIKKLLPKAKIAVAHGQMDPDEIDLVFHAFKTGEVEILVATSIIESGIDIPNANTIIVENANQFGISDLYQLRGRVGRWNRRAYAYFLLPKARTLASTARERLDSIALTGGYGGGMKMAMRDLEMRGAGDILGTEQSGHVSQIGFHLYCKLLKRCVDSMQGKAPSFMVDTKIEIPADARLPEYYVNDVTLRMELYQRFGDADTLDEVDALYKEVVDRFGKPPEPVLWLYHITRIRVFAAQKGYSLLKVDNVSLYTETKSKGQNRILFKKPNTAPELEKKIFALL